MGTTQLQSEFSLAIVFLEFVGLISYQKATHFRQYNESN